MFGLKRIKNLEERIEDLEAKSTALSWNHGEVDLQRLVIIVDDLQRAVRELKTIRPKILIDAEASDKFKASIKKSMDLLADLQKSIKENQACMREAIISTL